MKVIFMGTPDFSVGTLEALIAAGHEITLAVTQPDKPKGRGKSMQYPPVKEAALAHGIEVYQPRRVREPECIEYLRKYEADIIVVVAFGQILPKEILEMPKYGCINVHASLLPKYRGAAPIQWAVINGERTTGVTTFMIDDGMDTGGIMYRYDCKIGPDETVGEVHDKLMDLGSKLVVNTVEAIIENNVELRVQKSFIQGSEILKPAPKLTRELCHIDWNSRTSEIYNLIRGLSPYPAAYTELTKDDKTLQMKIYKTLKVKGADYEAMLQSLGMSSAVPGTILSDGRNFLAISTADGAISVTERI